MSAHRAGHVRRRATTLSTLHVGSPPLLSCPFLAPQELAEERERAAKAKELEVARLRAMQEKIQDNRAAVVGAVLRGGRIPRQLPTAVRTKPEHGLDACCRRQTSVHQGSTRSLYAHCTAFPRPLRSV